MEHIYACDSCKPNSYSVNPPLEIFIVAICLSAETMSFSLRKNFPKEVKGFCCFTLGCYIIKKGYRVLCKYVHSWSSLKHVWFWWFLNNNLKNWVFCMCEHIAGPKFCIIMYWVAAPCTVVWLFYASCLWVGGRWTQLWKEVFYSRVILLLWSNPHHIIVFF